MFDNFSNLFRELSPHFSRSVCSVLIKQPSLLCLFMTQFAVANHCPKCEQIYVGAIKNETNMMNLTHSAHSEILLEVEKSPTFDNFSISNLYEELSPYFSQSVCSALLKHPSLLGPFMTRFADHCSDANVSRYFYSAITPSCTYI